MERSKILIMVEGAVMVALAFGLSLLTEFIPFLNLPWGGSITLLSMLPIIVYSIRNGVESGLACSFVYSVVQLVIGMFEVLGWGLTPAMLAACFFFDYIGAFTVLGLAGLFRKRGMSGWIGGTVMAITLRYIMHVISGAAVFASVGMLWDAIEINNTWLYSMAYNACYMLLSLFPYSIIPLSSLWVGFICAIFILALSALAALIQAPYNIEQAFLVPSVQSLLTSSVKPSSR